MLRSERRVVITGLGLVSPLGIGPEANWAALSEGRGAVHKLTAFPVENLPNDVGGEVPDFNPKTWPKKYALPDPEHRKALTKSMKYMARDIQLAVAAAELAFIDAGLAEGAIDPTRIGVDLGAGLISTELDELAPAINHASQNGGAFDYRIWGRESIGQIPPIWLLKYLPNMLACHISILLDCQGPSNTITEAESASNLAIGEASRIIARGRADLMITGGADSKIHPLSLVRMSLLEQMSHWSGDPTGACRPFDVQRDGWVPGEGAGILVLEEREHALKRGARIHGEILGFGSGCDATPGGGLDPDGIGTEIALNAALRDAGLAPSEVGHVNAHGAASKISDLAEARAFHRVFGGANVPVTALKGYMGNLVSGCGVVELISSLIGVNQGKIPQTLNCDELDPACVVDLIRGASRDTNNPIFVNTNLTRHGQAAALVVRGNSAAN
ncbi:3-oxoacyl-[acyl-carrier-protein] synthase II [Singulisphaera sp. GP187]|uniref:beta-ketoacyl-[acyl-carrier-protein] synthase family protein n=1 Tax=Singulisphaera sp. GP187 TaxID=1882752 RepID=UPI0009286A9B|nr:beta-ketoacyl-[acyl-carrier-protein] synthase family protein [Singulisphaera sp. GP187]SIO04183.1 3-oxoacyl-[acyl-carrier-protein] synthase II [Singulisphaera sp. GP187]